MYSFLEPLGSQAYILPFLCQGNGVNVDLYLSIFGDFSPWLKLLIFLHTWGFSGDAEISLPCLIGGPKELQSFPVT